MRLERLNGAEVARLGGAAGLAAHLRSLVPGPESVQEAVREIIEAVRTHGDEAVLEYTRRFDTSASEPRPLLVAAQELDDALKRLPLEVVAGLQVAIANVAQVAHAGTSEDVSVQLAQGQRVRLREVPVASAAVYVPGGRAPYPSTVVMGVVTARAAGVLSVAVCSPPGADGQIDVAVLAACRLCGVERVYRMGGAQAIAALAHGTETVDRVDVVVGPGNLYVQQAKHELSAIVGIDSFAGPSDLLVILGADVSPTATRLAALDMLAQAEHGAGSLIVAIACTEGVADALASELDSQLADHQATVVVAEAADAPQALELANAFAPEHLQLIGADVEALASQVTSAGCVFVGACAGAAFGDYVAGSNHVLPTGGAARFASMLSARHFRRTMAEVQIDDAAAATLAKAGVPIARAEGFEWHARSMQARIGHNDEHDGNAERHDRAQDR
jgi:histidinol dehydrogenase